MRALLVFSLLTLLAAPALFLAGRAVAADPAAVAKIKGGIVDCVGCDLTGADLSNTCVKEHDLHGADFTGADASLMCMSFADFTGARFRNAELSGANMAGAKMDGADLTGENLHHIFPGYRPAARQRPYPDAAGCRLRRCRDEIAAGPARSYLQIVRTIRRAGGQTRPLALSTTL